MASNFFRDLEERYNIKYFVDDAVIVSYPKSGRTWLRMILAKLLVNMGYSHKEWEMLPCLHATPLELKQRIARDVDTQNFKVWKDLRVLVLHRDPGNVCISHYSELITSDRSGAIENIRPPLPRGHNVIDFLAHENAGVEHICNFNNMWFRMVDSKTKQSKIYKEIKFVSYENMIKDDFLTVKGIVDFLRIKCTTQQIMDAIEYSRFDNMKKIDELSSLGPVELKKENLSKGVKGQEYVNYLEHYKGNFGVEKGRIRKGPRGGYRKELRQPEVDYIDNVKKQAMIYQVGDSDY